MKADNINQTKLNFIFSPKTFALDIESRKQDLTKDQRLFVEDKYRALYEIGFKDYDENWTPSMRFLYEVSKKYIDTLIQSPDLEIARDKYVVELSSDAIDELIRAVPFAIGSEYIDNNWIKDSIIKLNKEYQTQIATESGTVDEYLRAKKENLRVPERIFFHLVENKGCEEKPFAFLATYSTTGGNGKVRHEPLQYALTEYQADQKRLISLLSCLEDAAKCAPFIGNLIESGELFHPLWFTANDAYELLKCVKPLEEIGIMCRIPNWWKKRKSQMSIKLNLGEKKPSKIGFTSLISCVPSITIDGVTLTKKEIQAMLAQTNGLAFIKGKWIEVDQDRLNQLLQEFDQINGEMTLINALRKEAQLEDVNDDLDIENGKWLNGMLEKLSHPETTKALKTPSTVCAQLRPYQKVGYSWLCQMSEIGFGACLADDMGLGKTLQILTFLERMRSRTKDARVLLVVPKSLLGNWINEIHKFTPKLDYCVFHGQKKSEITAMLQMDVAFLTITTYQLAAKIEEFRNIHWTYLILDEAQAIKNPGTAQTRAIKSIQADQRIAMTGTPVENDLSNLWSIFDFLNKGLLGNASQFAKFQDRLRKDPKNYDKLRSMLAPFILRRLKTDKTIISDLPDKLEQIEYVDLSKKQVTLYRKEVNNLINALNNGSSGLARRGLILAEISKLKQICNHPDQYLGQPNFDPEESGKFEMLREICETIKDKHEQVLVFTQYREIIDALSQYLESIFKRPGAVIHGGTTAKKRTEIVETFNGDEYIPFMIISLKAGGTGLNLTAANHVIHFDRWWNPAVENQATDRAFRIGQKKNVIVHKFVCKNTIEDKIDAIINEKKALAETVIGKSGETWITEMSNDELIELMNLEV